MKADVLCITGDHSTPATLAAHSWHPVPFLLNAPYVRLQTGAEGFGERSCALGSLGGTVPARMLLELMLANALKLKKFGA
jgi:2,3-bisphosphoglycerate-independent phosphoglycerate mutase